MDAVALLRELVRMPTVNPPGDEGGVVERLRAFLAGAGLQTAVLTSPAGRPNLVARLPGPRDVPALVLLSHADVVPVERASWRHDPFGGEVVDGVLWGRGTLDMKGIAVMHAVAAAELARRGGGRSREVVVVVCADEEAGGGEGARWLVAQHADQVGFTAGGPPEVLGEGGYGLAGILDRPIVPIVLGEKAALSFDLVVEGPAGHGALPPERQAALELAAIVRDVAGFRPPRIHPVLRAQLGAMVAAASGPTAALLRALASPGGPVLARAVAGQLRKQGTLGLLFADSVTLTAMAAGYKGNVVPGRAQASFDARLLPDADPGEFVEWVARRARRHGGRVENVVEAGAGPVSGQGSLFPILVEASRPLAPGAVVTGSLTPAITDVRFFRAAGARGYGWCPLVLSPELLAGVHGHDERVPVAAFEQAVTVMTDVVRRAAT